MALLSPIANMIQSPIQAPFYSVSTFTGLGNQFSTAFSAAFQHGYSLVPQFSLAFSSAFPRGPNPASFQFDSAFSNAFTN